MKNAAQMLLDLRLPHETPAETLDRVLTDAMAGATLAEWARDGRSYCVGEGYVELNWTDYWGKSSLLFDSRIEAAAAVLSGVA